MTHLAPIGVASLLASGLLYLYRQPLAAMVSQWDASPMYSYAYTVPLISLFLAWSRRDAFRARPVKPATLWGSLVVAGAFVLLAVGDAAAILVVQQISFLIAIAGLVLLLCGFAHLRVAAPAIAYLLFMVPIWDVLTEPLHLPFQNNSAELGVAMLHAAGIPAYREGTLIALSNVTLEVARECSGVNYLVAVVALALPLAFLRLDSMSRRVALITAALVIAALANGLRVALIGTLAYLEIGSPLHGPFHVLHGLFVAGIGYVVLFAGLAILERPSAAAPDAGAAPPRARPVWRLRAALGVAAVVWVLAVVGVAPRPTPVVLAMPLEQFPSRLGAWSADFRPPADREELSAWPEADSQLRRRYARDGRSVMLDVWYFAAQRQDREIMNYRAADLYREAVPHVVSPRLGDPFPVNVINLPGELGLFWYVLNGSPQADHYAAKLRSVWIILTSGHTNGAAVMLRTPLLGTSTEAAVAILSDLAGEVHVALGRHWHAPSGAGRASAPR